MRQLGPHCGRPDLRLDSNRLRFEPGRLRADEPAKEGNSPQTDQWSEMLEAPPGLSCDRLRRSSLVSAWSGWAALRGTELRLGSNRLRFEPGRLRADEPAKEGNSPQTDQWSEMLEAPPGFEPGNRGFAGHCLTTWLRRLKGKGAVRPEDAKPLFQERETGLEPATPTLARWCSTN